MQSRLDLRRLGNTILQQPTSFSKSAYARVILFGRRSLSHSQTRPGRISIGTKIKFPPQNDVAKCEAPIQYHKPIKSIETPVHSEVLAPPSSQARQASKCVEKRLYKKTPFISASLAISQWLKMKDDTARRRYFENTWPKLKHGTLQAILFKYLHQENSSIPSFFDSTSSRLLRNRGYNGQDVMQWAHILCGDGVDQMLERYLEKPSRKPAFVLLKILRHDIQKVESLHEVLAHVWDELKKSSSSKDSVTESDETFTSLIRGLLYHSRRIWPSAMVAVTRMIPEYMDIILSRDSCDPKQLGGRTHQKLCKMCNDTIRILALPASIEPLKSMVYNWEAQRVLLELAERFEPALIVDEGSYLAISQVLAASKKSARESRATTLRSRDWPPWRVAQDGIDAQRPHEDDMSRVSLALERKGNAGYRTVHDFDSVLSILGGQESDGTPTIHTRKLVKVRSSLSRPFNNQSKVWAARIEATRDVQEAWIAFKESQDIHGIISQNIYLAMFSKLNFNSARVGRKHEYQSAPGDGKEVLPAMTDNLSNSYKLDLQPPSFDELYKQMLRSRIRPSGKLLGELIRHAQSIEQGFRFLHDSKAVDRHTLAWLAGDNTVSMSIDDIEKITTDIFHPVIILICRFAPRAIRYHTQTEGSNMNFGPTNDKMTPKHNTGQVDILEPKQFGQVHPLLHAAALLKQKNNAFRPAWYSLFEALARANVVIARELAGDGRNDVLAWRVLGAALADFHNCKLELDPRGFQLLCFGLCKALPAFSSANGSRDVPQEALAILKSEFRKISKGITGKDSIPRLLHSISGVHIHAYMRSLGNVGDLHEIVQVLIWMVRYHKDLTAKARQSQNGDRQLRHVFLAAKLFLGDTNHTAEARELVESVKGWAWPEDAEVAVYAENLGKRL